MKNSRYPHLIVWSLLLMVSIGTAIAAPAEPDAVQTANNWDNPRSLTTTANSPNGAIRPVIAVAPNGDLIVVYLKQQSADEEDTDPFYRRSSDKGATWTPPAPIYTSGTDSRQVSVTFDNNNKAHAVWVEDGNQLRYGKENVWASNASKQIFSGTLLIESPKIAVDSNNVLHLAWSQNDGGDPSVYYARSTDVGSSWSTPEKINELSAPAESPALTIDSNNRPNVVWEEQVGGEEYRIRFSRRPGTGNWTLPRAISNIVPGISSAREAEIEIAGNRIMVVFENRLAIEQQYLYYLECTANCTDNPNTSGQWQYQTVTVQAYGAKDTDPTFLSPNVALASGCRLVIFSGITGDASTNNEKVRLASSCTRFTSNPIIASIEDKLGANDRAIKPTVAVENNWTIFVVYEVKNSTRSDIFFVKNQPAVYLPVTVK